MNTDRVTGDHIVNRTYGTDKKLNINLFFTNNIWSCLLWSPVIAVYVLGVEMSQDRSWDTYFEVYSKSNRHG